MLEATFRMVSKEQLQVVSVSKGVEALLGFTPDDFLATRVCLRDLIHPHDSDVAIRLFSSEIKAETGTFNIRLRHADGRIRCICAHCAKEVSHYGEIILDLVLRDPKSLKQDLDDQRFSVNLRAVMESVDECVYFKNRNHVITEANLNARLALSDSDEGPRDLVGLTDYDLLPEELADRSYGLEKQILAGKPLANEIQESVDKEGNKSWTEIRKFPVKNESGETIGLFGIARVVTDRMLAEQALRESEESLRESQRIVGLGSYVLDIPSTVWKSSDVLDQLFGIGKEYNRTLAGWLELIHPDDREMVDAHFKQEVLSQGKPFDQEYRIVRQDDQAERWVHGRGRLDLDAEGRPVKMHGTIKDITERKLTVAALRESGEMLQLFIEHAPAALAMFDREMRYLAASRRWLEDYGLMDREVAGRSQYEILPEIPERWKDAHRRAQAGEIIKAREDSFQRDDGSLQWLRWEVRPWYSGDGAIGGIMIFSEDTTLHKQAEERLKLAASVFTHASEGILITDARGNILEVNESFTRITGYTREEVLGCNPRILNSGLQSREFYEDMWLELSEMGRWSGEIWNRAKDGQILIETLTINAVPDASGKTQQYVALFSDITSMKEQKLKLENIAHFDPLTGLPNRVLLADRLHQAMAQSHRLRRPMAIACLDLDNFKDFNDRHGHNTGDQLLTAVTQRMKLALSEGDTLARRGGDEFVVVLPELANVEDSASMLTRLLQAAAEPVHVGDLVLRVSASLGVTFFPQADDVNADQLLRQADHAMYQAKLEGKNRYHIFDPWLDRTVRGHHEDLERIRLALEAREFVLYFQPKVNMCTGEVLGAEALIRWQHPERGLLLPAQFLPVIEGHPLAVEIGEWVIDSALTQMERWHAEGLDIPVSVNIGAQQLQRTGFVARLSDLLGAHPAVAPSSLELEVLESSALQDVAQVAQVIRACGRLGVSFALDDFGTGYSSLTYLRRLPIDVLKIDQTFVRDMLEDPEDLTILEGILGLAAAFRRQIVAEGVETVDHGLMLLRLGCQVAQGYGIARPMPAHDFPAWSAAWLPDPRWHNVLPIDPGDRPLLYAGAEHSAWIDDIESFLEGYRYLPPVLDPGQCRFGAWLQGEDLAGRGWLPALQEVELSHRYLHELANEILAFKARNLKQEALSRIPEIRALRDALFKKLDEIIWGI